MKSKTINYNTGLKKYALNGDKDNCIYINTSDINLYARIKESESAIDEIISRLDREEKTPELFVEVDKQLKAKLNEVFGTDISGPAFGTTNCLSPLDDGELLFMSFFNAFVPAVLEDMKGRKEAFSYGGNKKVEKYLPPSAKPVKADNADIDLSKLTPEQISALKALFNN